MVRVLGQRTVSLGMYRYTGAAAAGATAAITSTNMGICQSTLACSAIGPSRTTTSKLHASRGVCGLSRLCERRCPLESLLPPRSLEGEKERGRGGERLGPREKGRVHDRVSGHATYVRMYECVSAQWIACDVR